MESRPEGNEKIICSTKVSADGELGAEAYEKTKAEQEIGVLAGPYLNFEDILFDNVTLVPRHGNWEQHGGATEASVRCIDDMLVGEQNSTVGTVSTHRPTDPDGLVSQVSRPRKVP